MMSNLLHCGYLWYQWRINSNLLSIEVLVTVTLCHIMLPTDDVLAFTIVWMKKARWWDDRLMATMHLKEIAYHIWILKSLFLFLMEWAQWIVLWLILLCSIALYLFVFLISFCISIRCRCQVTTRWYIVWELCKWVLFCICGWLNITS